VFLVVLLFVVVFFALLLLMFVVVDDVFFFFSIRFRFGFFIAGNVSKPKRTSVLIDQLLGIERK
jgi:hypothetical protein